MENYIPYNYNCELYQLPCWKTYKDEEFGSELTINLLDIKYIKSYTDRIEVLIDTPPIKYKKYMIYIKVDQAFTNEIEVSESIYRQIEKDLVMNLNILSDAKED